MPTHRIQSSPTLLDTLRALSRKGVGDVPRTGPAAPVAPGGVAEPEPAPAIGVLRRRLRDLLAGIDADDPEALANVQEPVLREIVLWEFGSRFRNDAQFQPMVEALGRMLHEQPGFRQRFAQMVAELRRH